MTQTEPRYAVGTQLYFSPALERMPHGSLIPAGMVTVKEVVDHGPNDPRSRERWTYVVAMDANKIQGAAESELHIWCEHVYGNPANGKAVCVKCEHETQELFGRRITKGA